MDNKILKRSEVSENLTWNISDIYSSVEEWEEALLDLKSKINDFVESAETSEPACEKRKILSMKSSTS